MRTILYRLKKIEARIDIKRIAQDKRMIKLSELSMQELNSNIEKLIAMRSWTPAQLKAEEARKAAIMAGELEPTPDDLYMFILHPPRKPDDRTDEEIERDIDARIEEILEKRRAWDKICAANKERETQTQALPPE